MMKDNGDGTLSIVAPCSFEKQEPVAWMREDGVIAFHKQKEIDSQGFKWQPLYTSPQYRELSDDEIEELREYHGISDWLYETSVKDFANAILERAKK